MKLNEVCSIVKQVEQTEAGKWLEVSEKKVRKQQKKFF